MFRKIFPLFLTAAAGLNMACDDDSISYATTDVITEQDASVRDVFSTPDSDPPLADTQPDTENPPMTTDTEPAPPDAADEPCLSTCASDADCPDGAVCALDERGLCRQCVVSEATCEVPSLADAIESDVVLEDPDRWVGTSVTLKGTLMPGVYGACDDFGPCGTCTFAMTLDSALQLTGMERFDEACGVPLSCSEAEDTCWPVWSCARGAFDFDAGSFVVVRGRLLDRGDPGFGEEVEPLYVSSQRYAFVVEGIAKANPEPDHVDTVEGLFTGQVVSDSRCDDRVDMEVQMLVSTSAPDPGVRLEFMSPSGEALPFAKVTYTGSTLPGSQCVQMFGDSGDELIVCLLAGTPMTFNGVYGHPELACELQLQGGRRY